MHEKTKGEFTPFVVVICYNIVQSRMAEQAVISACIISKIFSFDKGDKNDKPTGSNKIRGISKDKVKDFEDKDDFKAIESLLKCTSESNMLSMMGY